MLVLRLNVGSASKQAEPPVTFSRIRQLRIWPIPRSIYSGIIMTTLNSNSSSSPMSEFTALKEKIKGLKCQQADLEREIESLQAVEA